jgi:hypothetical protein
MLEAIFREFGRMPGGAAPVPSFPRGLTVGANTISTPNWGINGADATASSWPIAYGNADYMQTRVGTAAEFAFDMEVSAPSPYNTGVLLNGDYWISYTGQTDMGPGTDDFWLELFIETHSLSGSVEVFDWNDGTRRWNFEWSGNKVRFRMDDGPTSIYVDCGTGLFSASRVYYIVIAGNRSLTTGLQCFVPQISDLGPLGRTGTGTDNFNTLGSVIPTNGLVIGASSSGSLAWTKRFSMMRLYKQADLFNDSTWLTDCMDTAVSRATTLGVYGA